MAEEAQYWKANIETPVFINLGPQINSLPPHQNTNNLLGNIFYSLQLRLWSWRYAQYDQPEDIKIFVVLHDSDRNSSLYHSLGLEKGKIGLVNAYATKAYQGSNNFIIAHELLHTFGATDKYEWETNQPSLPDGYANPEQVPLYPQSYAEIMGGRIPYSESKSEIPTSLRQVVVGKLTATEIGWKQ